MAATGTTEVTTTEKFEGVIGTICLTAGNFDNAVTFTLSVRDEDGFELYSKAAIAENGNTVLPNVDIIADGILTIGATASGTVGAGGTVDSVFYGVR